MVSPACRLGRTPRGRWDLLSGDKGNGSLAEGPTPAPYSLRFVGVISCQGNPVRRDLRKCDIILAVAVRETPASSEGSIVFFLCRPGRIDRGSCHLGDGLPDPVGHDGVPARWRPRGRTSGAGVVCKMGSSDEAGRAQHDLRGVQQKFTGALSFSSLLSFHLYKREHSQ